MKKIYFIFGLLCIYCSVFAQPKITISVDGKDKTDAGFIQQVITSSTSGKPDQNIVVTKKLSATNFLLASMSGTHFNSVNIDVYNSESASDYHITLKEVTVSAYKLFSGAGNSFFNAGNGIYEEVTLKYQRIETRGSATSTKTEMSLQPQMESSEIKTMSLNKDSVTVPIDNGYESVQMSVYMRNNEELELKVNGRIVANYTQTTSVYLDGFLKRNANNVINFKFSSEAKESDVSLQGKFSGSSEMNPFFNFRPKAGKTDARFEIPFTGKNK